jgi:hypothetical protein
MKFPRYFVALLDVLFHTAACGREARRMFQMNDDAARIAQLEREVERLREELARHRPAPRVVKVDGSFMGTDLEQTERLVRRVLAKYPILDPDRTRDPIPRGDSIPMVRSGMIYLASLRRTKGKVNREKMHLDCCICAAII